jgi:asparagine synthase (glutamine-hydrolysing)
MCGISGIALPHDRVDPGAVERMSAALVHRGPDDSGIVSDGNVCLANRRLSIVDLPGGHQPMTSADGRFTVTYNGEIYNAPELRRRHEQEGRLYRTTCDTETLLHLYADVGKDLVHHLRGCFAFALWDRELRELLLVRDRLGVKPLYFVHGRDGSLVFASEIKALLAAGTVAPELNVRALPTFLAHRATYGEETLFDGVRRLLPGHRLVWRDGDVRTDPYWDIAPANGADGGEGVAEWLELFRESVRLRLMADVPIGVFLSGGIDSSAITGVMSQLTDEPVRTFSVGFSEAGPNELPLARSVAAHFGTEHRDVTVTPREFFDALPLLTWHHDEPIGHPASVPLYFVSKLAAGHVKAVLSGEGADETLAGYARYPKTVYNLAAGRVYERVAPQAWRRAFGRRITGRRLSRTFLSKPADIRHLYFDNFAAFDAGTQLGLVAVGTNRADPHEETLSHYQAQPGDDVLSRMLYADCKTYLHALLMKQDKMSMAASLESRVPFLDHELVELTARLPARVKLRHGRQTKHVLRRGMETLLPKEVLTRRKLGFPVPIDAWLRGPFRTVVDDYVLSERARERRLFEPESVTHLVREFDAGSRHGERIWTLVAFEHWARCFLDGERPTP